jgi:hypothetical protein
MMTFLIFSSWTTFLDYTCPVKSCGLLPIVHYGRDTSRNIFTCPLPPNGHRPLSKWYLLDAYIELALWLDEHCASSSSFIMMMSWECTWELTPSYSSRHILYSLNSLMNNLRITSWITPWSSHNLLYFHLINPWNQHMAQALSTDKSYKYNLMQTLVHRDCH